MRAAMKAVAGERHRVHLDGSSVLVAAKQDRVALHPTGQAPSWDHALHDPAGRRMQHGFNGRFRDELLNETLFSSLDMARQEIRIWHHDYNHHLPHSNLGNVTPAEFVVTKGLEMRAA